MPSIVTPGERLSLYKKTKLKQNLRQVPHQEQKKHFKGVVLIEKF